MPSTPLLFAEGELFGLPTILAVTIVLVLMVFFGLVMFVRATYKRCPSNRVLVIYGKTGKGEAATCIAGGAKFVIPLIQDYAWLSLEPMQIEIPLRGALSIENIRVNVPSVFTVAIGTSPEYMQNSAIRLLGLSFSEIKKQAEDIIFGQLRQVIASMQIEEINRDRDTFLLSIQNSLEPELRKIGLVLINVNITDITDESGYIEAIGQKAASEAINKARGDVADNEKMGAIRVAEAEREKCIQVANAEKTQKIGTREAEREKAVRVAELDKEQQVGEQSAGFQREAQVKEAERDMRVRLANADARAVEGENLSKADIAASQATLQVKKAEAYELGETRKVRAEAAVLEAEHLARAKAAIAEAQRVEAKRRAELEAPAKAEKAKIEVDAHAEAAKRRIEAEGEASAIFLKLEAEARGNYEILAKKGEGLRRIVEACGGAQEAFQMLMLEHFDNLVDASAKAISNIKFDKVVVWDSNGQNGGGSSTANWLSNMARTLPPMMQVMKDIGGVELPETLASLAGASPKPNQPITPAPRSSSTTRSPSTSQPEDD
ncbi:MAG: flotillin [Planctomycetes bacterium RBG_13_63_9]|nr:MAG: flotillin [Planctomycetes bacterium RBG_13_63_9]